MRNYFYLNQLFLYFPFINFFIVDKLTFVIYFDCYWDSKQSFVYMDKFDILHNQTIFGESGYCALKSKITMYKFIETLIM